MHPAVSPSRVSRILRIFLTTAAGASFFLLGARSPAAGLVRDGTTARTQAMGGASTAIAQSPIEALTGNPAALGEGRLPAFEFTASAIYMRGRFRHEGEPTVHLRNRLNALADAAIAFPTASRAVSWGLAASPSFAGEAEWRYRDVEGGLEGKTSYGEQKQHATFLVYNLDAGLGVAFSSWFSAGASLGLRYNYNALRAPYTFQSQQTLRGFKTNLDLETDGIGIGGQLGITLRPLPKLTFSATYIPPTEIRSDGTADADLSAQLDALGSGFASVPRRLKAEAEVLTKLPQKVSIGLAWKPIEKLLLTSQWDWINWSDAFDDLTIHLSDSSNESVNALVGADEFTDFVPLLWHNQTILRVGAEYLLAEGWKIRAGYSHSTQAVPGETLTPHLAALAGHQATAGLGYSQADWHLDLSWQWHFSTSEETGRSRLRSGEYSDSEITIASHWLGLTYGREF